MPVKLHCFLQQTQTVRREVNQDLTVLQRCRTEKYKKNFTQLFKFLWDINKENFTKNYKYEGHSGSISHLCDLDEEVCMATVQVLTPSTWGLIKFVISWLPAHLGGSVCLLLSEPVIMAGSTGALKAEYGRWRCHRQLLVSVVHPSLLVLLPLSFPLIP